MPKQRIFLLASLAGQAEGGKPFDGMAAGTFVDMWGREATIDKADFETYLANTRKLIESTRGESGQVVGLPIDCYAHDLNGGAGWITAVEKTGEKIQFTPRWTNDGMDLIASDKVRFFSPSIDLANKVILGGSLTNWPATRTPTEIKLRPIELSAGDDLFQLVDGSLDEQVQEVRNAFTTEHRSYYVDSAPWPMEVFEDYLIAQYDNKLYRVNYSRDAEEEISFAPMTDWVEVKLSYVEMALDFVKRLFSGRRPGSVGNEPPNQNQSQEEPMTEPTLEAFLSGDPARVAELNGIVETRVKQGIADLMESQKRTAHIAEFSAKAVAGSMDHPVGLPIPAERLSKFMTGLSAEQQTEFENIIEDVLKAGKLVEFSEIGHSKTLTGRVKLDAPMAAALSAWIEGKQTIEEFFKVNAAELGAQADYDLSAFEAKK